MRCAALLLGMLLGMGSACGEPAAEPSRSTDFGRPPGLERDRAELDYLVDVYQATEGRRGWDLVDGDRLVCDALAVCRVYQSAGFADPCGPEIDCGPPRPIAPAPARCRGSVIAFAACAEDIPKRIE